MGGPCVMEPIVHLISEIYSLLVQVNPMLLGIQGGEAVHQLTIAEMPKHNHKIALRFESNGGSIVGVDDGWNGIDAWTSTEYQGNDQPHENPPPYYALYYIRVKICAQCFLL